MNPSDICGHTTSKSFASGITPYLENSQRTFRETASALPVVVDTVRQVIDERLQAIFELQETLLIKIRTFENRFLNALAIGFQVFDHAVAGAIITYVEGNYMEHDEASKQKICTKR
jgi:hypothetical protein